MIMMIITSLMIIQGRKMFTMMRRRRRWRRRRMRIISPFGQLGLWAPSSGVYPRSIHINHVCFLIPKHEGVEFQ
jgi:hypothetical protein